MSCDEDCKALSMLKNAHDILESEGYFYAKDIEVFLQEIERQDGKVCGIDRTPCDWWKQSG